MSTSSRFKVSGPETVRERGPSGQSGNDADLELSRWGGAAGLVGGFLMFGAVIAVVAFGLPDASDVETLTDFASIETGRIVEHFLYLGALVLFSLHILVLHRLLKRAHPAAALFGAVLASLGLGVMAASSLLHVSTSPLAELYDAPTTSPEDQRAIEYAWHGAQSVFDTMLTTGVLLVPIGIVLLGVAMRRAPAFGSRLSLLSMSLGAVGVVGAAIAVIDPGSMFSAASVFAITAFHLGIGWRTVNLNNHSGIDLTESPAGHARL